MYSIFKLFNPEIFQGHYKSKNYFEGWYFKLVDERQENIFAVIPGIAYGKSAEDKQSFIQVIDSANYQTHFIKYDIGSFKYAKNNFAISIADNEFRRNGIILNIKAENLNVKGTLEFLDILPFPKTLINPGIMGPFSYIPFMECYHGIINIQHKIKGDIKINEKTIDFSNGNGYIEKDWGRSFPEWWIWLQSNNFEEEHTCMMFSIAKIPWLGKHFTGFVSFLSIMGKLYRFTTYTGAKVKHLEYENGNIKIMVTDRKYSMTIAGNYKQGGVLKAPKNGLMHRKITESISSDVQVTLEDHHGNIIFNGWGRNAGMEIVKD